MRLWLREEITLLTAELRDLQKSLVRLAEKNSNVLIPGYTHLQRAQPVSLAHQLLAFVEMLERDWERMTDCQRRANVCPLGSGALAGSTLPLDRAFVARQLGFLDEAGRPRFSRNSMDAVSDRDFAVEFCAGGRLGGRPPLPPGRGPDPLGGQRVQFHPDGRRLHDRLQPDAAEEEPRRGRADAGQSGRVLGNLMALLALLKGLPMTYNRDLQEDKERLFDTADTVRPACA